MTIVSNLGQQQVVQAQPLVDMPGQTYAGLQVFWQKLRDECEERFTPAQCQALLGARPTILEPGGQSYGGGLPWYMTLGIGIIIGKVIL